MKNNNGFTLVEAMLAATIVIFVVVSILSGFTQQMVTNRYAGSKNIAINLAESRMEQYLKYPASQMPDASVDYVVESNHKLLVFTADPDKNDQYKRTVEITEESKMKRVRVTVEYGKRGDVYPFRVVLNSMRGG